MQEFKILVKTLAGLEDVLVQEIVQLGGSTVEKLKRAVSFYGTNYHLYKASMALRTAVSVQVPIAETEIYSEQDLYAFAIEIPWEDIFHKHKTFSIDAFTHGEIVPHSKYAALKTKDAIVDRFRNKYGKRPNVDASNPDIKLQVHISHKNCTILLVTSPAPLDKRGFKSKTTKAPLNEVLAAGILLLSGYTGDLPLYDLMAGSGTFSQEAALIALQRAPNLGAKLCVFNWSDFDFDLYKEVKTELINQSRSATSTIFCQDIDHSSLEIAQENLNALKANSLFKFSSEDFFQSKNSASGLLILNPPYNKRLELNEALAFYKRIGDTMKNKYAGSKAAILSDNKELLKRIGLKSQNRFELNNGGLPCWLYQYELY